MNSDPSIRKVVHLAEQAQPPVHVPIVLGNEYLVVTQQDVRRIEDSRLYSYNKLNAKGELVPMDTMESNDFARDALFLNARQPVQIQQNAIGNLLPISMLSELIARACNVNATTQQQQQRALQIALSDLLHYVQPQPIPNITVTPAPTTSCYAAAATLQQQLDWAKACNSMLTPTSVYPLHHTSATSTTEISRTHNTPQPTTGRRKCCTRACNTMDIDENLPISHFPLTSNSRSMTCVGARQQAKQRKMVQFDN